MAVYWGKKNQIFEFFCFATYESLFYCFEIFLIGLFETKTDKLLVIFFVHFRICRLCIMELEETEGDTYN